MKRKPSWLKNNNDKNSTVNVNVDDLMDANDTHLEKKRKPSWLKNDNDKNSIVSVNIDGLVDANNTNLGKMTLDEIFSDDNVEIYKKKNYVKLIREDEDIILTVDLKKRNGLESVTSRKYNKNLTKEETRDLIKELYYEEKLTQAEIADIVGLTQPQISVILKKY